MTMKPAFTTRTTCRLCESAELSLGLSLQPTPIGDDYITAHRRNVPPEIFNLDLYLCSKCGQVQLRDVVSPELLYSSFPMSPPCRSDSRSISGVLPRR